VRLGAGLGGLAAAAAFANRGTRVLVLERLANFGDAATVYRHGALTMEASLHETDGDTVFRPNSVFSRLGLTGSVEAIETGIFYEARGGALASPIQIPSGLDNAHEALSRSLPDARKVIDALVAEVDRRFPGFAGAVSQSEIATARTMKSRLGTAAGEVYGFRPTPSRLIGRPPNAATSIDGLWLSSDYTVSGGYSGAMQGGLMAADAAARSRPRPDV
jgi:phytoene dehydrogenase-like protein